MTLCKKQIKILKRDLINKVNHQKPKSMRIIATKTLMVQGIANKFQLILMQWRHLMKKRNQSQMLINQMIICRETSLTKSLIHKVFKQITQHQTISFLMMKRGRTKGSIMKMAWLTNTNEDVNFFSKLFNKLYYFYKINVIFYFYKKERYSK